MREERQSIHQKLLSVYRNRKKKYAPPPLNYHSIKTTPHPIHSSLPVTFLIVSFFLIFLMKLQENISVSRVALCCRFLVHNSIVAWPGLQFCSFEFLVSLARNEKTHTEKVMLILFACGHKPHSFHCQYPHGLSIPFTSFRPILMLRC